MAEFLQDVSDLDSSAELGESDQALDVWGGDEYSPNDGISASEPDVSGNDLPRAHEANPFASLLNYENFNSDLESVSTGTSEDGMLGDQSDGHVSLEEIASGAASPILSQQSSNLDPSQGKLKYLSSQRLPRSPLTTSALQVDDCLTTSSSLLFETIIDKQDAGPSHQPPMPVKLTKDPSEQNIIPIDCGRLLFETIIDRKSPDSGGNKTSPLSAAERSKVAEDVSSLYDALSKELKK